MGIENAGSDREWGWRDRAAAGARVRGNWWSGFHWITGSEVVEVWKMQLEKLGQEFLSSEDKTICFFD